MRSRIRCFVGSLLLLALANQPPLRAVEWEHLSDYSAAMTAVGETTALVVDGAYTYATYTDGNQDAVVARRDPSGAWDSAVFASGVLDDSHNGSSIGIDPDGYVHVVWDIHSSDMFNYKKSATPGSIHDLADATIGGAVPGQVSYARFYRAGGHFYLMFRNGHSGYGDEWIKKWTPGGWVNLATPLISGITSNPIDSPYIGASMGAADGSLHVVWTHRIGWLNQGIYYAKYSPTTNSWTNAAGTAYTTPIDRSVPSIIDQTDATVSNAGLGVALDDQGRPVIAYSRRVHGSPEVFVARYRNGAWLTRQITNFRLPRLRSCPVGPQDGPPRPCDLELQGPFLVRDGAAIRVYFARSVDFAGPAWQRPPALVYEASSVDLEQWHVREVRRPVGAFGGEVIRESRGAAQLLFQELSNPTGNLWLWTPPQAVQSAPSASIATRFPPPGRYVETPDADAWSGGTGGAWTISAWVVPEAKSAPMGIVDKGGPSASREYRMLLWGNAPPFAYDATRVQILIGGASGGWGLLWHPVVSVTAGTLTNLAATWDGSIVRMYKDGAEVAQTAYAASPPPNGTSAVLVGANRDGAGTPENSFTGSVGVSFFRRALTAGEVASLYEAGAPFAP